MRYILVLFIVFLSSCTTELLPPTQDLEDNNGIHVFEANNGFEIFYNSGATKSVKEYYTSGSIVVNGSYFGKTSTGFLYPAGIWREGGNEFFSAIFDDPNITHVVRIARSDRRQIDIFPNDQLLMMKWGTDRDTFQAGPLVLSGNILQDFGASWHANEPHERTLLGKTASGNIYFFVFTEPKTLTEVGNTIVREFGDESMILINLDGGPSTAYYDGKDGFRENEKLPIIIKIQKK